MNIHESFTAFQARSEDGLSCDRIVRPRSGFALSVSSGFLRSSFGLPFLSLGSDSQTIVQGLAEKLDNTRQKLSELIASATDKSLVKNSEVVEEVPQPPKPVHPMDKKAVDDDLARRISRLSKPDSGDKKK